MKRRICRKITKERLDEYLALVGCSTRHHGANTWRIRNAYGEPTVWRFHWRKEQAGNPIYDLRMDGWGENKPFGKAEPNYCDGGFGSFLLAGCLLEAVSDDGGKTYDFVSISAGKEARKKGEKTGGYAYIAFTPKFEPRK